MVSAKNYSFFFSQGPGKIHPIPPEVVSLKQTGIDTWVALVEKAAAPKPLSWGTVGYPSLL